MKKVFTCMGAESHACNISGQTQIMDLVIPLYLPRPLELGLLFRLNNL